MRTKRFHGLKREKIRQTWNKYNLYNLSRFRSVNLFRTHYQQKWDAKRMTRAYHGEQIREKQWQRQFTSRIRAVIPMNHRYLALHDGSEQAQGRGSGREQERRDRSGNSAPLPYMHMTYAPTERRLDTAIFRALFASSARQARQFVIHGAVKVNGKKMIYPGYLLNPGDMFQVEPERVLFATGAPKDAKERRVGRHIRRKAKEGKDNAVESGEDVQEQASKVASAPAAASGAAQESASVEETGDAESKRKSSKVELKYILDKAKTILNEKDKNDGLSAKRKQELRAFTASVRKAIGQINKKAVGSLGSTVSNLDDELTTLLSNLSISKKSQSTAKPAASPSPAEESESSETEIISKEDRQALYAALKEARENPIDPTKPYATPWRPRPYMSAFAFIPRYLEVNQNICSAVYLRHPVVRPKLAEVPTPFSYETSQLAFAWYLRRR